MAKDRFKILQLLFITFVLFVCFSSCTQVTPELRNSNYSVIFRFNDTESNPDVRLSVFVESDSDVRRFDRIVIKSLESGFIWDTSDIKKIEVDNIQYAGVTNLIVPENEVIPTGKYLITCINADEKTTELQFVVSYDEIFYTLKEKEVEERISEKNGLNKIAIYDKDKNIIYYGFRNEVLKTNRDIWNYYRNADYYQNIWTFSNDRVICISSSHKVVPEKD